MNISNKCVAFKRNTALSIDGKAFFSGGASGRISQDTERVKVFFCFGLGQFREALKLMHIINLFIMHKQL